MLFTHGARGNDNAWAIGAQSQPGIDLVGEIRTDGRSQEQAANAATKWIKEHCTAKGLELLRVESFDDRYPEDQRPHFSLIRFTIARPEVPGGDGWKLPQGLPSGTRGRARPGRGSPSRPA